MKTDIEKLSRAMKEIKYQIKLKSKEDSDSKKDSEINELKQQLNKKKSEIEQKQEQIERERTEQEKLRSERKELEKEQKGKEDRDRQEKENLQNEQDLKIKNLQKSVETLKDKIADFDKIKSYQVKDVTQKRKLKIIDKLQLLARTEREKIVEDESEEKEKENLRTKADDMKTREEKENDENQNLESDKEGKEEKTLPEEKAEKNGMFQNAFRRVEGCNIL